MAPTFADIGRSAALVLCGSHHGWIDSWQRITDNNLSNTSSSINAAGPKKISLSAHDTCDYALKRFENELKAGATYQL